MVVYPDRAGSAIPQHCFCGTVVRPAGLREHVAPIRRGTAAAHKFVTADIQRTAGQHVRALRVGISCRAKIKRIGDGVRTLGLVVVVAVDRRPDVLIGGIHRRAGQVLLDRECGGGGIDRERIQSRRRVGAVHDHRVRAAADVLPQDRIVPVCRNPVGAAGTSPVGGDRPAPTAGAGVVPQISPGSLKLKPPAPRRRQSAEHFAEAVTGNLNGVPPVWTCAWLSSSASCSPLEMQSLRMKNALLGGSISTFARDTSQMRAISRLPGLTPSFWGQLLA